MSKDELKNTLNMRTSCKPTSAHTRCAFVQATEFAVAREFEKQEAARLDVRVTARAILGYLTFQFRLRACKVPESAPMTRAGTAKKEEKGRDLPR